MLASTPLPPISTAMPASAIINEIARSSDSRSPRIGHARNATQTGIEIPSTAASLAPSHSSASPMNATQPPIVSIETSNSRSHIRGGTPSLSRRASAIRASAAAPTMPHSPRDDSGGHSVSRCFMIGKLSPQPTDATVRKTRPSGDIRARPAWRGTDMVAGSDPKTAQSIWFRSDTDDWNSPQGKIYMHSYHTDGCRLFRLNRYRVRRVVRPPPERRRNHRAARSRGR